MQLDVIAVCKWNEDDTNFFYSNDLSHDYYKINAFSLQVAKQSSILAKVMGYIQIQELGIAGSRFLSILFLNHTDGFDGIRCTSFGI